MAKFRVRADGTFLAEACKLAGIRTTGRADILGVSASCFRMYARKYAMVADKTLCVILSNLLDRVGTTENAVDVLKPLQKMLDSAAEHLAACRMEIVRRGTTMPLSNELPQVSELLAQRGSTIDVAHALSRNGQAREADELLHGLQAGGGNVFDLLVARGKNWYQNGNFDEAAKLFEQALELRPGHLASRLDAVKSHLDARCGDLRVHWCRATALLARTMKDLDQSSPVWQEWQFWLAVSIARNPANLGERRKFADAASAFEELLPFFENRSDRAAEGYAKSQLAAALFRSGDSRNQAKAIFLLHRLVRALKGRDTSYQRATASKFLGNCLLLLPADGEALLQNLKEAARHYSGACRIFGGQHRKIEWALARYSQGNAYLALGRASSRKQSWFAKAETACLEAIEVLSLEHSEDWGRAKFNLAECYHRWPRRSRASRANDLRKAIALYKEVLVAFPRGYIPVEWCDTHIPLASAYAELAELENHDRHLMEAAISSLKAACTVRPEFHLDLRDLRERYQQHHGGNSMAFDAIPPAQ